MSPAEVAPRARRASGPRVLSTRSVRWLLNLYPPFLFQGVRVREITPDFLSARLEVKRSLLTRNLNGTTFGGAIFAAADPIHSMLYWQLFARRGERVRVWLAGARIEYRRPARSRLTLDVKLDAEDVELALEELRDKGRTRRTHGLEAVDEAGELCARIEVDVWAGRR